MKVSGADLRCMRLRSGKTTAQMASYAGVKTRKTYENWEKGQSIPSINQYIAIAHGCGFDVVKLINLIVERGDGQGSVDVTLALRENGGT